MKKKRILKEIDEMLDLHADFYINCLVGDDSYRQGYADALNTLKHRINNEPSNEQEMLFS